MAIRLQPIIRRNGFHVVDSFGKSHAKRESYQEAWELAERANREAGKNAFHIVGVHTGGHDTADRELTQIAPVQPVKRGRGRPRKIVQNPAKDHLENGKIALVYRNVEGVREGNYVGLDPDFAYDLMRKLNAKDQYGKLPSQIYWGFEKVTPKQFARRYHGFSYKTRKNPAEVDETAARELYLTTDTEPRLAGQLNAIRKNLAIKRAKGTYKRELAVKAFQNAMLPAVKSYINHVGGTIKDWSTATRKRAAEMFVADFEDNDYSEAIRKNPTAGSNEALVAYWQTNLDYFTRILKDSKSSARDKAFARVAIKEYKRDLANAKRGKFPPKDSILDLRKNPTAGSNEALVAYWQTNLDYFTRILKDSKSSARDKAFARVAIKEYKRDLANAKRGKFPPKDSILDLRKNSGDPANYDKKIDDISRMFQGRLRRNSMRVPASELQPSKTARLGQLKKIIVKNPKQGRVTIDFSDGEAILSADRRKNLHISGNGAKVANVQLPKQGLMLLGSLMQVNYITDKKHIENGQTTEYYHPFGELNRQRPQVYIDSEGFLQILGGDYDIWREGIVN